MKRFKGIRFGSLVLLVAFQTEIFADEDCVGTMCERNDLAHSEDLPKPQMEEYDYRKRQKTTKKSILAESTTKSEARARTPKESCASNDKKENPGISSKKERVRDTVSWKSSDLLASMELGDDEDTTTILSGSAKRDRVRGIRVGERIESVIHEDLTVSGNTPIPVSAEILSGPFKGGIFKGEASLEPDLKLIRISFNQLIPKDRDAVYTVGATARRKSENTH